MIEQVQELGMRIIVLTLGWIFPRHTSKALNSDPKLAAAFVNL